jgi:hypothetical protein
MDVYVHACTWYLNSRRTQEDLDMSSITKKLINSILHDLQVSMKALVSRITSTMMVVL